jgi:hypothetical protein
MGLAAMVASLVAGCSTGPKVLYHAGDELPPDFLAGPAGVFLTNVDGFSAHVTASLPGAGAARHSVSGDMLGRQGILIFQPATAVKGKRARSEGGTFFIWNETKHEGFVLSDPLQAYAPVGATVQPTNVTFNATGAVEEVAGGHPCRRIQALVQSSDGTSAPFTLWQAEDARHFPVRIRTAAGPREMTLDFSDVRLDLPAAQLFGPPDGFTQYDSAVTLMNELIIRQTALAKGNGIHKEEAADVAPATNWRPNNPH